MAGLAFIAIGDDALSPFQPIAEAIGVSNVLRARGMVELESMLAANPRAVLIADAKSLLAEGALFGHLRRVLLVPVIAVYDGPLRANQLEILRLFGAHLVIDTSKLTSASIESVIQLARNARAPLDTARLPIKVLLQRMADSKVTAQVSVTCPHAPMLWMSGDAAPKCTGIGCTGWYGSVIVRGGTPTFFETGTRRGDEVANQFLALDAGATTLNPVFITPQAEAPLASAKIAGPARASTPPPVGPRKEKPMSELDKVLKAASGLRGIARSNPSGGIEEFTGQIDAESVCAVAAMCAQHLRKIEELLGCGDLSSWALTTESTGFYVHHKRDGIVAIIGEPSKNPDSVLRKTQAALGEPR